MKKIILGVLFCAGNYFSNAQGTNFQWAKTFSGTSSEFPHDIAIDPSGNVCSAGRFQSTVDFDPGAGTYTLNAIAGENVFISKIDPNGNLIWAKQFGGAGSLLARAYSIAIDGSGNIYTCGIFVGTVDFDPGPGVNNLNSTSTAFTDGFISKLDASGNFIWAKQFAGTNYTEPFSIALDNTSNVYTTGRIVGSTDFDPGIGIFNVSSVGFNDIFVSKLNSSGNFVWAFGLGGSNSESAQAITLNLLGDVFITGSFQGTVDFDPGAGTLNLNSAGNTDVFVCKYSSAGTLGWAKRLGGAGNESGISIVADVSGKIYSTGAFDGTTDFDPGSGTFTIFPLGSNDIFISKLDASGNFEWAKSAGGTGNDAGYAVTSDPKNNVYTTGIFQNTVDFDPGPGTYTVGAVGGTDVFISKLDSNGVFKWTKCVGGVGTDYGQAISIDANRNVYSAGYFNAVADFDPEPSTYTISPAGLQDVYIHKLGQCDLLSTSIISQSITCNGLSNGSATVTTVSGDAFSYTWMPTGGNSQIASGLAPGTYSAAVTNSCGISVSQTVMISQPPALTLAVTASQATVCSGNSVTLNSSGSGGTGILTYSWVSGPSSSTYSVTPFVTSTYTAMVTDVNSCVRSSSIQINVNPLPSIFTTSSTSLICVGQSATLTATGASSYTWSPGGPGVSIAVSPSVTTTYTVTGTNSNGCSNTSMVTQNVSTCAGINEIQPNIEVDIIPNPSNGNFEIKFSNLSSDSELMIANAIGQVVFTSNIFRDRNNYYVEGLSAGIYFCFLKKDSSNYFLKKIVVN